MPGNTKIWNIVIDGVIDTSPENVHHFCGIHLGVDDPSYGISLPDSMKNITISNVICNSNEAIVVNGYLKDSVITNVINRNPDCSVINVKRKDGFINVATVNLNQKGEDYR